MYGCGDDIADMSAGIRKTRRVIKKAYDALKTGNVELTKEFIRQADQAALDSLCMIGAEDEKGLDGKKIKASWQKE